MLLALVLFIGSLMLTYFVIRKGVHHGILDADESRRAYERKQRLKDSVRQGTAGLEEPLDPE